MNGNLISMKNSEMHCTKIFSKEDLIVWDISHDAVDRLKEKPKGTCGQQNHHKDR